MTAVVAVDPRKTPVQDWNVLLVAAALLGLAWGGEGDVLAYLVGRYFGLEFFGAIYGVFMTMHLLGGVSGPYLVGLGFDILGSYTVMLGLMAAIITFAAVLILFIGRYPNADDH